MSDSQLHDRSSAPLDVIKRAVVGLIGRERVNRLTAPFHDWSAKKLTKRTLATLPKEELFINIGCGPRAMPGWLNVDIARAPGVNVVWDLRNGLPFPSESCAAIFGEHVIEHMPKADAQKLFRECHRALKPNGVIRLSTPDAGLYLHSYSGDQQFLHHSSFSDPIETPLDRINMMMRENGLHLWVYDRESLSLALRRAGFSSVVEQKFGESMHPRLQNIDTPARAFESLYVEGIK